MDDVGNGVALLEVEEVRLSIVRELPTYLELGSEAVLFKLLLDLLNS